MRYKINVPAHVEEREKHSRTTCDSCGQIVGYGYGYTMDEVELEARIGDVYPERDCRIVHEVDLCGNCFVKKVVPALATVGIVVRTRRAEGDDDGMRLDPEVAQKEDVHGIDGTVIGEARQVRAAQRAMGGQ